LRNFVLSLDKNHGIMKCLFTKTMPVVILFFLYSPFVWAQDSEFAEQTGIDTVQMYVRNAQYRQAIEYINRFQPTKDLLYQQALCYKSLNEYSKAIEILNALSEEYPDDVPTKLQLALCYEAVSRFMKSIDCYDQLLKLDSTNTYFKVRRADLLYRSEKYALAIDTYSKIDSTYFQNYIARSIAMCYEKLNQPDSAKIYYGKAWELDEQDAFSANSLVKILVKKEDFISAYENSERFIEKDSTNSTMNALNAIVYYNLKRYDVAIERFKKCMQQGDSSLMVNQSLGISYYLTDNDSLARPLLQQASLQDTTNTNVLYYLGKVNYRLGYYQESIACFKEIIKKTLEKMPSPGLFYSVYYDLALAYEKNEAFESAVEFYLNALSYAWDNMNKLELYYKIANLSDEKLHEYETAIAYYKQYRVFLYNYRNSLKAEKEINEIDSKLKALDEYILRLTEEAKK